MHHHRHSSAAGIATICRYDCITFGEFSPICSLCATSAVRSTAAQGDDDLFFCTSAACYCACAVSCENSRPLCQWNANAVQ